MELFRCSKCNCLISSQDLICPYCGSYLEITNKTIKEHKTLNKKKRNVIISLIIGGPLFLFVIMGATFAYFSATTNSALEDVTVNSAYVSIQYDDGTKIELSNLIPTTKTIALKNYKKEILPYNPEIDDKIIIGDAIYNFDLPTRKCVDDKGNEVCYIYQFSIENDDTVNEFTNILGYISINKNEFENLNYALYEVTLKEENGEVLTDKYEFDLVESYNEVNSFRNLVINNTDSTVCLFGYKEDREETYDYEAEQKCATYAINNNVKHTYQLVIWTEKTSNYQEKQNLTFEGDVYINVSSNTNN